MNLNDVKWKFRTFLLFSVRTPRKNITDSIRPFAFAYSIRHTFSKSQAKTVWYLFNWINEYIFELNFACGCHSSNICWQKFASVKILNFWKCLWKYKQINVTFYWVLYNCTYIDCLCCRDREAFRGEILSLSTLQLQTFCVEFFFWNFQHSLKHSCRQAVSLSKCFSFSWISLRFCVRGLCKMKINPLSTSPSQRLQLNRLVRKRSS